DERTGEAPGPGEGPLGHHLADEVAANDVRAAVGLVYQGAIVEVARREHAVHRPADAQAADPRPRVDAHQAQDVVLPQVMVECALRAETARRARCLADDKALDLWPV